MGEMRVQELGPGLWRWEAPHPEWPDDGTWDESVGSVYLETLDAVVLIDPLVPDEPEDRTRFWRALARDVDRHGGPVVVVLTCRWHVRSAREVGETYPGTAVWAPARADGLLEGLVTDLLEDGRCPAEGVLPLVTGSPAPNEEVVIVLPAHRALIVGDILLGDTGGGLTVAPASWYSNTEEEREWFANRMRPSLRRVLEHDVDLVLPAHGEPILSGGASAVVAALGSIPDP